MAEPNFPPEVAHLPVCPHRKLPIPYIAETDADGVGHFTVLDHSRAEECLNGRLCAMCGLQMGDEVALLGDVVSLQPGGFFIEPPVHERCAELAAGGLCPFVSRQRVPRRPPEEGVTVVGPGRDELAEIGRSIPKRPWVMAITRTYQPALMPSDTGSPVMVYMASRIERVRRYAWDTDGRLVEALTTPAKPLVRVQPRRKSRRQRKAGA